ncbi:MAG TPA: double zinc ribbon domain-containing protein [Chloroflexota bacterium]|nr:double zinc ribbon domain-containing protein [Chloroflexota bacterium]
MSLATALETLLDAVFPPRCAGCARLGSHFCLSCRHQLRSVQRPWCSSCGCTIGPDTSGLRDRCAECVLDPLPLHAVRSVALFVGPLRLAIHRFKYRGRAAVARGLVDLMVDPARLALAGTATGAQTIVVPVPLSAARERERGYNQAALLAAPLARALRLPLHCDALHRIRHTPSQVGQSRPQRRENVRGAFASQRRLMGSTCFWSTT